MIDTFLFIGAVKLKVDGFAPKIILYSIYLQIPSPEVLESEPSFA